jgi:hypothetical protein
MEIYKGWQIEQNEFGYWEATNLNDCDAYIKFSKSLEQLKIDIDEVDD